MRRLLSRGFAPSSLSTSQARRTGNSRSREGDTSETGSQLSRTIRRRDSDHLIVSALGRRFP
jgi:hypothetical protein